MKAPVNNKNFKKPQNTLNKFLESYRDLQCSTQHSHFFQRSRFYILIEHLSKIQFTIKEKLHRVS